jgi:NAD(P) transhydrogenase subunit alpha
MIVGVLKEPAYESRVSLLAESAAVLVKRKLDVWVESSAGEKAFCPDPAYSSAGARLVPRDEILASADLLLGIRHDDIPSGLQNKIVIGIYQPLYNVEKMAQWAGQQLTSFSLDMLPRTTRAQNMDVLSSQASIAGYKAVLVAANTFPRYFPMFMTAAGSVPPAKVLILGAGVAGLQAIATARRLGAVVEVFDTRPSVKEEVMSLGGKFIEVEGAADASGAGGYAVEQSAAFQQRQQEKIAASIARADIVITTAQIPGKQAPQLVTAAMIEAMRPGSVIVDLAAATGGNTELTKNNTTQIHGGITIIGDSNLAATLPYDASKLYGRNVLNFLQLIIDAEGKLNLNFDDDLVKGCCITHNGSIVHQKIKAEQ